MRIVSWNLRHGGGRQMAAIAVWLAESGADVVVLLEWRRTVGGQIAAVLADHGLTWQWSSAAGPRENGVLVASNRRSRRAGTCVAALGEARAALDRRVVEVEVEDGCGGLRVVGVHVPCDGPGRDAVLAQLVESARSCRDRRCVVVGDLNVGGRGESTPSYNGGGGELALGRLWTLGFRDAWEVAGNGSDGWTWRSREGIGYRIDQAWVSASCAGEVGVCGPAAEGCWGGVSDHSPLVLDLRG